MNVRRIASIAAVAVVGMGGIALTAGPAEAATGCTAKFTSHGRGSNNVYAHSSASCSGSVTKVSFTTKAYMYYVDHYADGAELGNSNMTMKKSGHPNESVTAQDDHCDYKFTATVYYTIGKTSYSKSANVLNYSIC